MELPGNQRFAMASARDGNGVLHDSRLYQLVRQHGTVREQTLEIMFLASGTRGYAFTFG